VRSMPIRKMANPGRYEELFRVLSHQIPEERPIRDPYSEHDAMLEIDGDRSAWNRRTGDFSDCRLPVEEVTAEILSTIRFTCSEYSKPV
jgi:hypothetical protein